MNYDQEKELAGNMPSPITNSTTADAMSNKETIENDAIVGNVLSAGQ